MPRALLIDAARHADGAAFVLPDTLHRHLSTVLRLAPGEGFVIFDGVGGEWTAEIVGTERRSTTARLLAPTGVDTESPLPVHLGLAVSKGERMDFALQKATELGVATITPLFTERAVVRLDAERLARKSVHWLGVVEAAAEQSGRTRLPTLHAEARLEPWLTHRAEALKLVLAPHATARLAGFSRPASIALLVGPEGGLSEAEIAHAEAAGFTPVGLGPRVLRTETAPLAALAAINVLWGDF